MDPVERFDVAERMASSKARLSDKLSELARRVESTREAIRPSHVLTRPWVLFGIGAILGYVVGRRPASRGLLPERAGPGDREAAEPGAPRESFLGHAVKQLALAAAVAATRNYVARASAGDSRDR